MHISVGLTATNGRPLHQQSNATGQFLNTRWNYIVYVLSLTHAEKEKERLARAAAESDSDDDEQVSGRARNRKRRKIADEAATAVAKGPSATQLQREGESSVMCLISFGARNFMNDLWGCISCQ